MNLHLAQFEFAPGAVFLYNEGVEKIEELNLSLERGAELELRLRANQLRQYVVSMLALAGSGHPASSLGLAEVMTWLYERVLRYRVAEPAWSGRDRFFLSAGHVAPVWYGRLAQSGFFELSELANLRKFGSFLQGHPRRNLAYGIENSAGPLGQGLSQAVGAAYGLKIAGGRERVLVLSTDGEQQEGQVWEAYLFAAHYNLSNLTVIIDENLIQQSGVVAGVMGVAELRAKLESFNFAVREVDGHNFAALMQADRDLLELGGERRRAMIVKTVPGRGVKIMENDYRWHAGKISVDLGRAIIADLRVQAGVMQAELTGLGVGGSAGVGGAGEMGGVK